MPILTGKTIGELTQLITPTQNMRFAVDVTGTTYSVFLSSITESLSSSYLTVSGGTISGDVVFNSGLTANTISATTYQNLPVSGITQGNGISASTSNGQVTITNTDLGSSQNIFKNIQINNTTQFSAGSNNSDLNFSGINISITSASTNTLVFSAGTPGTVTSVALSAGTTGNDVNIVNSAITNSGIITINIPDASNINRGLVTTGSQTFGGTKTFSAINSTGNVNVTGDTTLNGNLTFTGQSNNPIYSGGNSSSTFIPNWNNSNIQTITLTAGTTNISGGTNISNGAIYTIILKQDSGGSKLANWGSNYKWQSGIAPVLTSLSNGVDILTFISDGSNLYGLIAKDFR